MILEIILLVMAIGGIYEGVELSKSDLLISELVGPGWYLLVVSCLLFVSAIVLLVSELRKKIHREVSFSFHRSAASRTVFLLFVYGFAIIHLGFIVASLGFFILIQRLFGERSWFRCALIGVSTTGSFYFVFSYLAGIPLP